MIGERLSSPKGPPRKTAAAQGLSGAVRYNSHLIFDLETVMEAEQLNQLANTLTGLQQRTADLRRYL
jgi:hypothetical protein